MNLYPLALRRRQEELGFTLAEMLTVLAIIVMLSLISLVGIGPFLGRNRIRFAARQAHAAILQARHFAIANNTAASLIVYDGEPFCVVTNTQYVPIDAPTILPDPIVFRVPQERTEYSLAWAQRVGDVTAAQAKGYAAGYRRLMVVTFQQDGTVRSVTGTAGTMTGGVRARDIASLVDPIPITVASSGSLTLGNEIDADDTRIELTGSYSLDRYGGYVIIDSEIIRYNDVVYDATSSKPTNILTGVVRGAFYTRARSHKSGAAGSAGGHTLEIYPLTGGVVQCW